MIGGPASVLKRSLLAMTAWAVIGDAILMPFYPQFFAARFGVTSPGAVGAYVAAICLVVMLALPAWARWLRGAPPLALLIWTQLVAGLLCLYCAATTSLAAFWIASLTMFAAKASYLLLYPYILSLESRDRHADTIGTLTVIVRFGAIAGALVGGTILQSTSVGAVFVAMAFSDFAQMALCLSLKVRAVETAPPGAEVAGEQGSAVGTADPDPRSGTGQVQLWTAMLVFYFGAFLVRPFFALYWIEVSGIPSVALSGIVFALPAGVALVALAANRRWDGDHAALGASFNRTIAIGVAGLVLQAIPTIATILVGRCLYGWSLFQITVALDAALFAAVRPARFAKAFSTANIAQNLGVIAGSLVAGACVAIGGSTFPFLVAAASVALTPVALSRSLFGRRASTHPAIKESRS